MRVHRRRARRAKPRESKSPRAPACAASSISSASAACVTDPRARQALSARARPASEDQGGHVRHSAARQSRRHRADAGAGQRRAGAAHGRRRARRSRICAGRSRSIRRSIVTLRGKTDAEVMAAIGHANEFPEGRFFPGHLSIRGAHHRCGDAEARVRQHGARARRGVGAARAKSCRSARRTRR